MRAAAGAEAGAAAGDVAVPCAGVAAVVVGGVVPVVPTVSRGAGAFCCASAEGAMTVVAANAVSSRAIIE